MSSAILCSLSQDLSLLTLSVLRHLRKSWRSAIAVTALNSDHCFFSHARHLSPTAGSLPCKDSSARLYSHRLSFGARALVAMHWQFGNRCAAFMFIPDMASFSDGFPAFPEALLHFISYINSRRALSLTYSLLTATQMHFCPTQVPELSLLFTIDQTIITTGLAFKCSSRLGSLIVPVDYANYDA